MKSYDELRAEMKTIQQQMAEAKKNRGVNRGVVALKIVKELSKGFGSKAGMLKSVLAGNQNKSNFYLPTYMLLDGFFI